MIFGLLHWSQCDKLFCLWCQSFLYNPLFFHYSRYQDEECKYILRVFNATKAELNEDDKATIRKNGEDKAGLGGENKIDKAIFVKDLCEKVKWRLLPSHSIGHIGLISSNNMPPIITECGTVITRSTCSKCWRKHRRLWALTRYVKLWVVHAPGTPETFSLSPTSKETAS